MTAHPLVADTKEKNLYWRGAYAYFRKRIGKKDHWESMGELSIEAARRLVREKRKDAAEQAYLVRWGKLKLRDDCSTVRELLAAYDAYTSGIRIEAKTVRGNKSALGKIFRTVGGDAVDVEAARLSELTIGLAKDYETRTIAERKAAAIVEKWDKERLELEMAKAARTAGSTWNQAKSLFSSEALASPAYRELILPDLTAVRKLRIGASTIVAYRRPPQAVLDRITAEIPKMRQTAPDLWLALNLEVNVGLRRSSGIWAKWDWLQERGVDLDGEKVFMMHIRVAKGNQGEVRVDPELALELIALKKDGQEYIVPGADEDERLAVYARACAWLRSMGLQDYRAPNHELRKWCIDNMQRAHGLTEAQNMAGHSDQKLTRAVYTTHQTTKFQRVI